MKTNEPIILSRDCEAIQIPSGQKVMLPAGSQVTVTQSLGGSYTVTTDQGNLVRIANKDADAIGEEAEASQSERLTAAEGPADLEKLVWDQLKTCFDPEIPVNIVDLGLVYEVDIAEGGDVDIQYTLTTMGCPIGPLIEDQMRAFLAPVPGIGEVRPEMVLRPAWTPEMMSEEAKAALGMF